MGQLGAITCGFPLCQNSRDTQTNWSKSLRVTAIALGAIATLLGALTLAGIPTFAQLGTVAGWTMLSVGVALAVLGVCIKCVKKAPQPNSMNIYQRGSTVDSKSTSESEIVEPLSSSNTQSIFPQWFPSAEKNISIVNLPDKPVGFEDLRKASKTSATLFSAGQTHGLYMKLRVEHINDDPTYDRSTEMIKVPNPDRLPSSQIPFSIEVIAWKPNVNYTSWSLTSNNKNYMRHRNAIYCEERILGDDLFRSCEGITFDTERLISVDKQDLFEEESDQFSLAWILLRLFNAGDVTIRERPTNKLFFSSTDPVVGYWKISLDVS